MVPFIFLGTPVEEQVGEEENLFTLNPVEFEISTEYSGKANQ